MKLRQLSLLGTGVLCWSRKEILGPWVTGIPYVMRAYRKEAEKILAQ